MIIWVCLGSIGLVGILGMTWLFPVVAIFVHRTRADHDESLQTLGSQINRIDVLIPAHNEEQRIAGTLSAIAESLRSAQQSYPKFNLKIVVGADSCIDSTAERARALGAEVKIYPDFRSKWKVLSSLISDSQADWIALVDADIRWDSGLLPLILSLRCDASRLLGVAPSFGLNGHWRIEKHFKNLENLAGGPVAIHGATVFYDRIALQGVLKNLAARTWINDDVLIPLSLRLAHPDRKLLYWIPADRPLMEELTRSNETTVRLEIKRRFRMTRGNFQVLTVFTRALYLRNPEASLLFLRRFFRIFWVYWLSLVFVSVIQILGWCEQWPSILAVAFSLGLMGLVTGKGRNYICAAWASLLSPWLFATEKNQKELQWK